MENKILVFLSVLISLCQCTNRAEVTDSIKRDNLILTRGECLPDVADKFVYPIFPGTEEWKNIGSLEEAINAFQLPDNVLKNISTLGLIRSFLDIPIWWSDYYLSSNLSRIITYNRIYPKYNSAQEFLERDDAGKTLFLYFDAICFDCLKTAKVIDQMNFMSQFSAIQVFFAQQKILDQLNHTDRKKAVALLLSKYEQVQKLNIEGFGDPAALEVMAYVMYKVQYSPVVEYFGTEENLYVTSDRVNDVISFVKNFIL